MYLNKLRRIGNMNNLKDFFLDFRDDTLDFIDDDRKGLIISSFILILLLIESKNQKKIRKENYGKISTNYKMEWKQKKSM